MTKVDFTSLLYEIALCSWFLESEADNMYNAEEFLGLETWDGTHAQPSRAQGKDDMGGDQGFLFWRRFPKGSPNPISIYLSIYPSIYDYICRRRQCNGNWRE